MEVVRITPRGYCHGVVEAIRIAKRVGSERAEGEQVTMLGYLVHNEHVTRELEEHGVAPRRLRRPRRRARPDRIGHGGLHRPRGLAAGGARGRGRAGCNVVDATCSDVTRTHDLVRRLTDEG